MEFPTSFNLIRGKEVMIAKKRDRRGLVTQSFYPYP